MARAGEGGVIQAGDLVRVVRWPCCGSRLGMIDKVESVQPGYATFGICMVCGHLHDGDLGSNAVTSSGHVWPVRWLKKIPPLGELEQAGEVVAETV